MENKARATLFQRIRAANISEDPRELRNIGDALAFNWKLSYAQAAGFFRDADPSIDRDRYEELMQIADYA